MRRWLLVAALSLIACGSDDDEKSKSPLPKCLSDVKLSGGVTIDDSIEYECGDGVSYTTTAEHVTVELRLPGPDPGLLSVRMFGLTGTTAAGTKLPTGLTLDMGVPPTESWAAGYDTGSACTATIEEQAAQPGLELVLVGASATCDAELVSANAGAAPVSVERLRVRALYAP